MAKRRRKTLVICRPLLASALYLAPIAPKLLCIGEIEEDPRRIVLPLAA